MKWYNLKLQTQRCILNRLQHGFIMWLNISNLLKDRHTKDQSIHYKVSAFKYFFVGSKNEVKCYGLFYKYYFIMNIIYISCSNIKIQGVYKYIYIHIFLVVLYCYKKHNIHNLFIIKYTHTYVKNMDKQSRKTKIHILTLTRDNILAYIFLLFFYIQLCIGFYTKVYI